MAEQEMLQHVTQHCSGRENLGDANTIEEEQHPSHIDFQNLGLCQTKGLNEYAAW